MPASVSDLHASIESLLRSHANVSKRNTRRFFIKEALKHREVITTKTGALATWNPKGETGRIPKDTYIVEYPESRANIDWSSPTCIPMQADTFERLLTDALAVLGAKERLYVHSRAIGADAAYALPTRVISDKALTMLFADNMFRPTSASLSKSIFADRGFTIVVVPHDKIDTSKYSGALRMVNGKPVPMLLAMDFDRRIALVYGCSYLGAVKKLLFTIMNYLLPAEGILPLHCSANEAADGSTALFLGLSGTGKTTLSNDPARTLIGDDEHGWSNKGIANFENGCYAKLINLRREKEPQVFDAIFDQKPVMKNGVIIENAVVFPDGRVDVDDERLAENSRASYLLSFLKNAKKKAAGKHPKTIIFLTADANGVLPPVAKLDSAQAMFWFLMGYTSKLGGTEAGISKPSPTFSRFFGGPFMPRNPQDYASLLEKKIKKHGATVYLVNTGWTGGSAGVGKRMDITVTRAIVDAAFSGALASVECKEDPRWHISVPHSCPGIDSSLLNPKSTWSDPAAYEDAADTLAAAFTKGFSMMYGSAGLDARIAAACPKPSRPMDVTVSMEL